MKNRLNRFFAGLILSLIIVYGILKVWVLRLYAGFLDYSSQLIGFQNNYLFETVRKQATQVTMRDQTLGWLIYYPSYFLLHILFIYVLFKNNRKVRNYLVIGLTGIITMLISGWIVFKYFGLEEMSEFFRSQFRSLFGLPFILLIIEGGRILYNDLTQRLRQINEDQKTR